MSEPELASELKANIMLNGSGLPLPKDTGWEAASEKKDEGENTLKTVEVERKEEKKDDAKMEEMEDEKVVEAEDAKITEPDDAKETKAKDVKVAEAEDAKRVEAEDGKVAEVERAKIVEFMDAKVEEPEDVTMMDAEAQKDGDKGEEEGEKEVEGEKIEEGNDVKDEKDGVNQENKVQENNEANESKRKRVREKKAGEKGDEKGKKESRSKDKKLLSTPLASSTERPVRERKTVERLVESLEKEPVKKFLIEKGCGTPLKEIPSVAYKLAKKKPADLKYLHQTLFGGRQGKVADFKNHILQFSGFMWHGDEEKQKTKVKDKLDKCVKDTLVDLCDLFDLPVSKTNTRKEELVAKLMDFMVAPHATTDNVLAEKEQQSTKLRKRKSVARGIASRSSEGIPGKRPRRGISKTEDSPKSKGKSVREKEEEEEQEDEENGVPKDNVALKHSESEEIESEEVEDDDDDDYSGKSKHNRRKSSKRGGSAGTKKSKVVTSHKKGPLPTPTKSPTKSSLKHSKTEDTNDVGAKVLPRKKKNVDVPEKKSTPKSDHKEKATGKKVAKGRAKSVAKESSPSKEELRKTICDILKEADFNTATFTDILKELAKHYSMDLTPRKKSIKLMIQEELTKLADEAEENEDVEEDGAADEDGKPETVSEDVEA
ncbi:DNA ligase 1-like [Phoenix dactylifera]|uniref:DNA ligase 1-like n=1 Tax=Phoenix dactylifera TaxID=42345 RepID=A0A8B9AJP9_PHODC|nr:DNA ligase 1-like [Phoenix dactylifera]